MALLHSRQIDHNFTGSFNLSGSNQSFISEQVVVGSNVGTAVAHESASLTVLLGDKKGMMLPSGSSDPTGMTTDSKGMMFYNTVDSIVKVYDGTAWIPAGDINTKNTHLTMSADINDDGNNSTILFRIDGEDDSDVKFRLKSDNEHEMTGSFNLSDNLTLGGRVLGDMRVTGDIIAETYIVSSSVTYLTQSFASGSHIFGDSLDDTHEFTGSLSVTGSAVISGSTLKVNTPLTSSTAIFSNNIQNGYPTSNNWQVGLDGSYFNNFDNTTHVSEVLRFVAGILSHSIDTASPTANEKYWNTLSTSHTEGSTTSKGSLLDGVLGSTYENARLSQHWTSSAYIDMSDTGSYKELQDYLILKGWVLTSDRGDFGNDTGTNPFHGSYASRIPSTIQTQATHGTNSHTVTANAGGSSAVYSNSNYFGMGLLSSGNAVPFYVRVLA